MKVLKFFIVCSLFIIHCLLCTVNHSFSQQFRWIDLSANIPEKGGLSDVVFIGDTGWISGGNGKVYYTTDGGQSFTIHNLPVKETISIINLLGVKVREFTGTGPKLEIDIRDLPDGTYFILLADGENRYSRKLIILR